MRRILVLVALASTAAAASGCGVVGSGSGSAGAPSPADLAAEAVSAARAAGSAHYAFDAKLEGEGAPPTTLHLEGDAGHGKGRADVSFAGGGRSLSGAVVYGGGVFAVRFLETWYGTRTPAGPVDEVERQFGSSDGVRERFDDLFEGSVRAGPVVDGVQTWAFNGRLKAGGLLDLTGGDTSLDDEARARLDELVRATHFTLLVGRADHLPRAFLLDVSGDGADLGGFAGPSAGSVEVTLSGSFSDWGAPVSVHAPKTYAPLEELYRSFFSF